VKKITSQNLWPGINSNYYLKLREVRFQKTARRSAVYFLGGVSREILKRDINSASDKVFSGGLGDFSVVLLDPKKVI